jgi:hypothetical protein
MGELNDFMSEGLEEMIDQVDGEPFSLRGRGYKGVVSDAAESLEWGAGNVGGSRAKVRLQIVFADTVFSPALRNGEEVRVRGLVLAVDGISREPGVSITIGVVDKQGS